MEIKAVVMGSGGVGKSALTVQYISGVFIARYDPTIEESYRKPVDIDGKTYLLELLDTAGTEQFTAMRDLYMKNGQGFILVFSLIAISTFRELEPLCNQISKVKEEDNIPMVLVGNKCDSTQPRQVSKDEAECFAKKVNGHYYESSAKLNLNVTEVFEDLVRQISVKYPHKKGKKGKCTIL